MDGSKRSSLIHILYSGLGGHASVVFSLVEADRETKFNHVLVFYGIEKVPDAYREKCLELGADMVFVHKKPGFDKSSYEAVKKVICEVSPRAIFLHSVNLIIPVSQIARRRKIRLIAVEHQPNHLKIWKEYIWSFLLMILADKVVYLTELYATQMKRILRVFFKRNRVSVINNGINTHLFSPCQTHGNDIGMLARIMPTKDHKTLLAAWKLIEENMPGNLLIAGDGDWREKMENYAKELSLNKIVFTGMLDEDNSRKFLNDLAVYVHASLGETMSTSIMQAMASGKVIVASNVPGINNMIQSLENGILVPAENAKALGDAILKAWNDRSLRMHLASNARKTAEEKFSNRIMFERYIALVSK